jgi:geranylgeranyl diphosphate synthase, type II
MRNDPLAVRRYLAGRRRLVERALAARFPPRGSTLRRAIRYSLLGGGKRLRPILALAAGEVAGAPVRTVLPFACALELVHTYSLVHDDLPAMDDDDLRRGRPTSHKVFGEGVAILVGDALLTEAFELMTAARQVAPRHALAAVAEVARAAGEAGMVGGQALDLAAAGQTATLAAIRTIHRRKTGALFTAAVRVGALVAGARPALLRRLTTYGEQLGLCFQIADDIADAVGAGDGRTDRVLGKATYPALLGMRRARVHAERARDAALAAVDPLGARAMPLRSIAALVVAQLDEPVTLAETA